MSERYTKQDVLNSNFYKMPKFLFEGEYKKLSSDAKILYTLLKDRHNLSIENNWINEKNQVFLIYTREEMADMLGCSLPTVRKAIKQLEKLGLIEEERQGLNKPNLIFLCYESHESIENTRSEKNLLSRGKETLSQECKKLSGIKTNNNKTNNNLHFPSENGIWSNLVYAYIQSFLEVRSKYRHEEHKKISDKNISYIESTISLIIENNIELEEFKESVITYFQELNSNNDGDILYFLKAIKRYFVLNDIV